MFATLQLPGDCWPTRLQTGLLRAALWTGEPARQAWQAWQAQAGDLDGLDPGSKRLLPLLYSNLRAQHVDDPLMGALKTRFRQTWYRNQALFHQVTDLLETLQAAHIDTLILKGAALSVLYYRELALRPMTDFDILVPAGQAHQAMDELKRQGWRPASPSVADPKPMTDVRQSLEYISRDERRFDLHWYALWDCAFPGADDAFWAAAVPLRINHITARALNPTDQLVHVCVHGASLNQVPPVRWVADAMQILRAPSVAIDWPRLLGLAERLRLSLPLHDTLLFLRSAMAVNIPEATLTALAAVPVTADDREFYRLKLSRRGLLGEIPLMWRHYRLLAEAQRHPATRAGFIRHLRLSWGLVDGRDIPAFVLDKVIRRLKAVSRPTPQAEPDLGPNAH